MEICLKFGKNRRRWVSNPPLPRPLVLAATPEKSLQVIDFIHEKDVYNDMSLG
ncbi:hypothetical protein LXA47_31780 [Massilia sp. P8910]|uniref:hypothetical protein n=1 Tax=Massilia antarctica TaxID=2765360 RepID=UPI001E5A08ED|nr:hypothetical protein [Massilia antarctica]MCE3608150.1 hypothetical protein [Massilia antarctica]